MSTETVVKKRFTADEYCRMAEVGILPETGRFELIDGEIIEMSPIGSRHHSRILRLTSLFNKRLGDSVILSVQGSVRLSLYSQPQPDLALLKPRADFYEAAHAGPEDILLVVEVAETSFTYDSKVKVPLYAGAGIAEYWLLDVRKNVLVVRTDPVEGEYPKVRVLRHGDTVTLQKLPRVTFSVDEILG